MKLTYSIIALLALAPAVLPAAATNNSKELEGTRAPTQTACPTPEEARKKMTVPAGYAVRCFAHEPMVQNPVAMTWDDRGRLWVVELYEYPEGSGLPIAQRPFSAELTHDQYQPVPEVCRQQESPTEPEKRIPRDRVIILEDTDNDGVADKRTVFVQGLDIASGILIGDGGVYVGQQPHLIHFKDTNQDDRADEWRVCLTGFGREDTHEMLNSFAWGPDGWLYLTHGVFTNSKVRRPGLPVQSGFKLDAGIARCRPITGKPTETSKATAPPFEFEVFSDGTSNPWGVDFDSKGNFFVEACVIDHLFHMAPGGLYQRQGGAPENPYAYELLPSIVNYKHFRAAYAGIQIYQGGAYPKDTHGNLFIGNIHDNAIHEEAVDPSGSTFKARAVRDFLRANDGWFRPVSIQTGPDANLWVMDWCDKYPCYQNAKANPEGVDRARGRIWRVLWTGVEAKSKGTTASKAPSRPEQELDLEKKPSAALVELLEHPNNWMRRQARRILGERKDATSIPLIQTLVKTQQEPALRLEALWTLHASLPNGADPTTLAELSKDPSPAIRAWVARLYGDAPDHRLPAGATSAELLEKLAADSDITVRTSVAVAARTLAYSPLHSRTALTVDRGVLDPWPSHWQRPEAATHEANATPSPHAGGTDPKILSALLKSGAKDGDRTYAFHLWMALEPNLANAAKAWLEWLAKEAPGSQPLSLALTQKALRRVTEIRNPEAMDLAVEFCRQIQDHDALLAQALSGIAKGQEGGVIAPQKLPTAELTIWRASPHAETRQLAQNLAVIWGDETAIQELLHFVNSSKASTKDRTQAMQTLRKVKNDTVRSGIAQLLTQAKSQPTDLVLEATRAASDLGGDELLPPLLQLARSEDTSRRLAALGALSARADWAKALLQEIHKGILPASVIPVSIRRSLDKNADATVRDEATKVLGAWQEASEDTKALIAAKRKAALTGEPNLENGKLLFQTSCMICHEFHGGGHKVGPELIGSGRSNLDALLANLIDPNQIIGNGYEAINVTTQDQRLLTGRMVEDTPGHVKLLTIGGAEQVIPRTEIAKLENTKQSLMPVGFGALPDEQLRDLVWYILAPPEEGPLTKEKKAALSANIDAAPKSSRAPSPYGVDWESVSHWNPAWQVIAPEFERTPLKLADFHERKNVLLMHPFSKEKPCALERKVKLDPGKKHQLSATVAAHDQGDWELRVLINGKVEKLQPIRHDEPRWKTVTLDLSRYAGQEVTIRLEGAATGWSWEFVYWGEVKLD